MYKSFMGSAGNIWSQVVDEDAGTTYGEQAVGQFLEQVELMYIMKEKAADYGVEVTSDDETAIADAAAQFMQDNDEDTLKELAVSGSDLIRENGMQPGKEVGEVLSCLLDLVIEDPALNQKETLLQRAKSFGNTL